jgi:hypothetical protein
MIEIEPPVAMLTLPHAPARCSTWFWCADNRGPHHRCPNVTYGGGEDSSSYSRRTLRVDRVIANGMDHSRGGVTSARNWKIPSPSPSLDGMRPGNPVDRGA